MLLWLTYTRLLLFQGEMHVGLTFSLSSILKLPTLRAGRMLLLMHYHVYLELRSCLHLCYVLWHILLVSLMLMMSLWLLRAVPWLHQLLLFLRMRLFWNSWKLSSSRVLHHGFRLELGMLSRGQVFLFLGLGYCVSLLGTLIAPLFRLLIHLLWELYWLIYTPVLWLVTLVWKSCWNWLRNVFIGRICLSPVSSLLQSVLCVRLISLLLRSLLVCCNL